MRSARTFAKLNLTLRIIGRRDDGYHLLQSFVAFAEVGDVLHVDAADTLMLEVEGPFASQLAGEGDNLILRAARALQASAGITKGAALRLEKHLPIASGIGGGSGDAAAALRLLTEQWELTLDDAQFDSLALTLGADIPVCLRSRAGWMEGIGERFRPLPELPPLWAVLINPLRALPTAEVFRRLDGNFTASKELPAHFVDAGALLNYLRAEANDLLTPALSVMPEIQSRLEALTSLPGVKLARLSGSGATCFGLCTSERDAMAGAEALKRHWPRDWIAQAKLR